MKRICTLLITFILFFFSVHLQGQNEAQRIDNYISSSLEDWNIPGVAIAIVKDGEPILRKGYGVKSTASNEPVDSNTLFAIASNTKAFISASISVLVEEGKLTWNDKVVDYLPYFKLYDPYVTAEFTISDLLCHRSGLATFSGDILWYGSNLSREEVIKGAAMLEPESGFREAYGYQNIMFMAAGEVIEEVTGMAWNDFVRKRFLNPLGMTNTIASTKDLQYHANHSEPHNDVDGENVPIDWVNWDNMGPAGSLISNVDDLSSWIELQLGKGTLDSTLFWKTEHSQLMWTVHTPKTLSSWHRKNFPSKHFAGYGLGWDLFDYHGHLIINHGGGYDGFISQTVLVPEENLGFVILTNNNNFFPYAMMYHILDMYLDPENAQDWGNYMLGLKKQADIRRVKEQQEIKDSRVPNTSPSLDLSSYIGEYHDPKYGSVIIGLESDSMYFNFKPTALYHGTLAHWHYDTFRMSWGETHFLPKGMATFMIDKNGSVSELRIDCPNPDLDFTELKLMKKEED
ncbi:MAG: serine hydrolase [Flavobacteriales bacterium]|nr:serine hydrolase [Flavobacteriales bacterium]